MPSTYSPSLRIELPGSGEQSGVWGTTTNNNLGTLLEQSIAGVQAITMTDANYTLSNYNGVSDEARKAVLVVSGTNAAVRDIIAPLVPKVYTIKNNTTGGFAINIRASSGASVSIANGGTVTVYCDGTNFLAATYTIAAGSGISIATVGTTTTITNTTNFISGTRMPFAQAAAPTGWTQDTSDNANNRMLRVVNSTGNGVGGSASPILNNTVPYHTHGFATGGQSANHVHYDSGHTHSINSYASLTQGGPNATNAWFNVSSTTTGVGYASLSGISADHYHTGSTDGNSNLANWSPRYINMIICSKN